ncbi:hypothetical protein G6L12_31350 [Agrobacterium rhizogenes]|nr:hypothetical protein [Rhizobium rhizogenes]NTF78998.1 hypothetical protein [Rhizobium rhizogenes]
MNKRFKISRRAFLVSALAASATLANAAGPALMLERYGEFGFRVKLGPRTLWEVTSHEVASSFGKALTIAMTDTTVTLKGRLLNFSSTSLTITFSQSGRDIYASASLALARGGISEPPINFSRQRIGSGWRGLTAGLAAAQARQLFGAQFPSPLRMGIGVGSTGSQPTTPPAFLYVDRKGSSFPIPRLGSAVKNFWLLSGERNGPIAIATEPVLAVRFPDQAGLSLTAKVKQAVVSLPDASSPLRLTGEIALKWGGAVTFMAARGSRTSEPSTIVLDRNQPSMRMYLNDHQSVRVAGETFEIGNLDGSPSIELSWKKSVPSFAVHAKLFSCGWQLPEIRGGKTLSEYSRLDFRGQVVDFLPHGKPGDQGIFLYPGSGTNARLPLDMAVLTVMRSADALRLRFGFEDMTLEATRGQVRLLPKNSQGIPRLKVEFPPQHIQERAYSWQLANLPSAPTGMLTGLDLNTVKGRQQAQTKIKAAGTKKELTELIEVMAAVQSLSKACNGAPLPDPGCPGNALTEEDLDYYYLAPELMMTAVGRYFARKAYELRHPNSPVDSPPVEARNAGVTRLVFDLPKQKSISKEVLSWSLAALLDWGNLTLAVATRAERAHPTGTDGLIKLLQEQGIPATHDAQLRMHHVALAAGNPDIDGKLTRIEVPARLWLSPATDAKFRHANDLIVPGLHRARPIWRVEMQEFPLKQASLRAIWSPDFEPQAFDGWNYKEPPKDGRQSDSWLKPPTLEFRTSLTARDRHQIVGLSSVYGLPVIPNQTVNGEDPSQVSPPPCYVVKKGVLESDPDSQALYIPQTLPTHLLTLSAMGASLDLDARFVPPASVHTTPDVNKIIKRDGLFDAFSIERWRTSMVFGREITTEIVYKGYLCPFGHEAALVKTTERRFIPSGTLGRPVIAYEVQRLFIRVGKPVKTFGAVHQPFDGRGWPARSVRINTVQTPDLMDPNTGPMNKAEDKPTSKRAAPDYDELVNGQIVLRDLSDPSYRNKGLIFWPRVNPGRSGDFQWGLSVEDGTDAVPYPMLFVDNVAANDAKTMSLLHWYYNVVLASGDPDRQGSIMIGADPRRILKHNGARRSYAAERNPGDTSFETEKWQIRIDSRQAEPDVVALQLPPDLSDPSSERWFVSDATMQSASQPPFYPRLQTATINYGAVGRFTGNAAPQMRITYYDGYLQNGETIPTEDDAIKSGSSAAPSGAAIFKKDALVKDSTSATGVATDTILRVLNDTAAVEMGNNGDHAGGLAQPNQPIRFLARIGPVGGSATRAQKNGANAQANLPNFGRDFFGDAKLLGIVPLQKLVDAAIASSVTSNAPILKEITEYSGDIDTFLTGLGGYLDKLTSSFKDGVDAVYPDAYAAFQAMDDLRNKANGQQNPSLGDFVAAGLRLVQALERIVSTPLAAVEQKLIDLFKQKFASILDFAIANLIADPTEDLRDEIEAYLTDAWLWLQPIDAAYVLETVAGSNITRTLTGIEIKVGGNIVAPTPGLLDKITEAIEAKPSTDPPPPRLADLLASHAQKVMHNITNLKSNYPGAVDGLLIDQCAQAAFNAISMLEVPDPFDRLYRAGYALYSRQWDQLYRSVTSDIVDILNGCHGGSAPFGPFLAALRSLISRKDTTQAAASTPPQLFCSADIDPAICNDLMAVIALNATLTVPSQNLLTASARVYECLKGAPDPATNLLEYGRWWRLLLAAWRGQAQAFDAWIQQVASSDWTGPPTANAYRIAVDAALLGIMPGADLITAFNNEWQASNAKDETAWIDPAVISSVRDALKNAFDALHAVRDLTKPDATAFDIVVFRQAVTALAGKYSAEALAVVDDAAAGLLLGFANDLAVELKTVTIPIALTLSGLYNQLIASRRDAYVTLAGSQTVPPIFRDAVTKIVTGLYLEGAPDASGNADDALTKERALLEKSDLADLLNVLVKWNAGTSAPQRMAKYATDEQALLFQGLKAALVELVDMSAELKGIEDEIQKLIPAKVIRSYDLTIPVSDVPTPAVTFKPAGKKLLVLSATASVDIADLAKGDSLTQASDFSIRACLTEFTLYLGDFIGLMFGQFIYTAGTGRSAKVEAPLKGIDVGPTLAFMTALFAFIGYAGDDESDDEPNGPYVNPMDTGAGIEAGYRIGIPAFSIGPIAFDNIYFDAHCDIPFDSRAAKAFLSLSSVESPFLISCFPYGGGGSIGASGDCSKFDAFSLSLEFGAVCIISYGPLSAIGSVVTGFYVVLEDNKLSLYGVFSASCTGHVACFSVSTSFYLPMLIAGKDMSGGATLSYSFSAGFASITFKIRVNRDEGASLGQNAGAAASNFVGQGGGENAAALSSNLANAVAAGDVGTYTETAPSPGENWRHYRNLYDTKIRPRGSRRTA